MHHIWKRLNVKLVHLGENLQILVNKMCILVEKYTFYEETNLTKYISSLWSKTMNYVMVTTPTTMFLTVLQLSLAVVLPALGFTRNTPCTRDGCWGWWRLFIHMMIIMFKTVVIKMIEIKVMLMVVMVTMVTMMAAVNLCSKSQGNIGSSAIATHQHPGKLESSSSSPCW